MCFRSVWLVNRFRGAAGERTPHCQSCIEELNFVFLRLRTRTSLRKLFSRHRPCSPPPYDLLTFGAVRSEMQKKGLLSACTFFWPHTVKLGRRLGSFVAVLGTLDRRKRCELISQPMIPARCPEGARISTTNACRSRAAKGHRELSTFLAWSAIERCSISNQACAFQCVPD